MSDSLRTIIYSIIFLLLAVLCLDYVQVRYVKDFAKNSLDLSTKAAALQLDEDEGKVGQGIFEIERTKAVQVNKDIFVRNMGNKYADCIVQTNVINIHTPQTYTDYRGEEYEIDQPTVFSYATIEYKGIARTYKITVTSASCLINDNELN